jgi:hypothetical protein
MPQMCERIGVRQGHRKKGSASEQGLGRSCATLAGSVTSWPSASEQGLGRSRGEFSTKIVLTAIDENTPVAVEVLPGQVHEATQVEKMLDASQARLPQIEEAMADKRFDGEPQRQAMASRNIRPVIPYRVNRRKVGV